MSGDARFCLAIKGFQACAPSLKEALLKELKDNFQRYLKGESIVKDVLEDEVVLADTLTLQQCEKIVVHLKESEQFRKLNFASVIPPLFAGEGAQREVEHCNSREKEAL